MKDKIIQIQIVTGLFIKDGILGLSESRKVYYCGFHESGWQLEIDSPEIKKKKKVTHPVKL